MQLPYSDQLNIAALSRLFDKKSECYKLFWFQAILGEVCGGRSDILYEDLIDEMIADAWYMVTEYHLNLGPRDTLERAVDHIYHTTGMLPAIKKQDILNWLKRCEDPVVIKYKLYPPQERKLEKVKKYWKLLSELESFCEIYGGTQITKNNISIDHFVPWSYVAHDEFWNLHPTTRSINSSKSNNLPDWEHYFPLLADLEYRSYRMIWAYDIVRSEFQKCAREHLNSPEIEHRLYRKGLDQNEFRSRLSEVIHPVYQSAKNCGFQRWEYSHE